MVIINELDFRIMCGIQFEYPLSQTIYDHEMEHEFDIQLMFPMIEDVRPSIHEDTRIDLKCDVKDQIFYSVEEVKSAIEDKFDSSHLKNNIYHNNDLRILRFETA